MAEHGAANSGAANTGAADNGAADNGAAYPAGSELDIRQVVAGYGNVSVLDHVTIMAAAGTITAVLGANGAGKTTLLRTISGSVRARSGQIELDGMSLVRRSPEDITRAGVSHVPEGQGVITELTVEENLRLGLLLRPRRERAAALADAYQRFKILGDRRKQAAGTLSGGERQILVIARALQSAPKVLLLDEPSLGLAPKIVAQVMDLIAGLRDESGLTVVLVEQNARSALEIADKGVVLNVGKVVAEAGAAELAADVGLRRHYLGF
jgi:branched-chain amino acid transport system ATP-binding protein